VRFILDHILLPRHFPGHLQLIRNYSSVSSVVQRVKLKLASDMHLQKEIRELSQQALKGNGSKRQKRVDPLI